MNTETAAPAAAAAVDLKVAGVEPGKAPAVIEAPKPARLIVDSTIPVLDTGMFEQMQRIAVLMAKSWLVPEHLNRKRKVGGQEYDIEPGEAVANCFLVVNQAVRWRMDPFAVAQGTFVTSGKIGYEGKLVAAVINTRPEIQGRLDYRYDGAGPKRAVVVSGKLKDDSEAKTVTGTVDQWQTKDRQGNVKEAWLKQPDQMLAYRGAREWARRWLPEAILGVYSDDEVETIESQAEASPSAPSDRGAAAAMRSAMGIKPDPAPGPAPAQEDPKPAEDLRKAVLEGIEGLAEADDVETLTLYAESLPDNVRADEEFTKAFHTRLNAIRKAEPPADPKAKAAGTPRLRKQFVEAMEKSTSLDFLSVKYDETRGYIWGKDDEEALKTSYEKRKGELGSK